MKKIAIFFIVILAIVSTVSYIYLSEQAKYKEAQKENAKFDIKEGQEVNGQELATLINLVIDTNKKNEVLLDDNGYYIDNEKNSINLDITFTDIDVTYNANRIGQAGITNFVQNYRNIIFKCNKVQYHESTGKLQFIGFEQITQ